MTTSPTSNIQDRYARWELWASPAWTALLFYGTLTHQPDTKTDFPGYARYITTGFLISHLVASIFGASVGIPGLIALFLVLSRGRTASLAFWAMVTGVIGNTLMTSVFGVAAFAQLAIRRAYLAGQIIEVEGARNCFTCGGVRWSAY
jgi:hypothetical protein